jgi:hypothetical protein
MFIGDIHIGAQHKVELRNLTEQNAAVGAALQRVWGLGGADQNFGRVFTHPACVPERLFEGAANPVISRSMRIRRRRAGADRHRAEAQSQ